MILNRRLIISFMFIIVSVGSAIYVSLATANYLQFYPALEKLDSSVMKLTFFPGTSSSPPRVVASVAVNNPTDYSGFTIRRADIEMFFFEQTNMSNTMFNIPNRLSASAFPTGGVPSNSADPFEIVIGLNSTQGQQLASFYGSYSQQGVVGWTKLRVDISTFLIAATGTTILDRVQNVTLTL